MFKTTKKNNNKEIKEEFSNVDNRYIPLLIICAEDQYFVSVLYFCSLYSLVQGPIKNWSTMVNYKSSQGS